MRTITSIACGVHDWWLCRSQRVKAIPQGKRAADHSHDSVEISETVVRLSDRERVPTGSMDRLAKVRAAVSRHDYVTKAKIEYVVNRLLDELEA